MVGSWNSHKVVLQMDMMGVSPSLRGMLLKMIGRAGLTHSEWWQWIRASAPGNDNVQLYRTFKSAFAGILQLGRRARIEKKMAAVL
jgi:hypothetical protein